MKDETDPTTPELIRVELTDDECTVLTYGLRDWGGPASDPTQRLAWLLGFASASELVRRSEALVGAINEGTGLTVRDWTRALLSAEIVLASDVIGTGSQWTVIHGGSEAHWIEVLRRLQAKIPWSRESLAADWEIEWTD